jgi:hypothetical protein
MATSYSNYGGTGDRRVVPIVITTTATTTRDIKLLIDGTNNGGIFYFGSQAASGLEILFLFPDSVIIDEAKWYQQNTANHGSWKWQGSNNGSDWSDIGSAFTLAGEATQTQTQLSGNTTAYLYYRLLGVSGNISNSPYIYEIEFKISGDSAYSECEYGDRDAIITVGATSGLLGAGSGLSTLVDGGIGGANIYFVSNVAVENKALTFDFATGKNITSAILVQSTTDSHGTWKWQSSDNNSDWADIGSSFTLGGSTRNLLTQLSGNTTAYRYYRIIGVSGNANSTPYIYEIYFGIPAVVSSLSINVNDSCSVAESTTCVTGDLVCSVTDNVTTVEVTSGTESVSISVTESITVAGTVTTRLSLGSICWGQSAGVTELVKRTFSTWTGTGSSGGSGDEEVLEIHTGEYMECAGYELGLGSYAITVNKYRAGGTPVILYKTATTLAGLTSESYTTFSGSFSSLGWVQVRLGSSTEINVEDVEVNLITLAPSVSDTISASEELSCVVEAGIAILEVSIIDTFSVDESVIISCSLAGVGTSETVLVQESVMCRLGDLELSVEESSSLSESTISEVSAPVINVSDSIGVGEVVSTEIEAALVTPNINVLDNISASDEVSIATGATLQLNIQDSVSVEDSIGTQVLDLPSYSFDTITLDEQTSVELRLQVEAFEATTVSEAVQTATSALEIGVSESLLVEEEIVSVTSDPYIDISDSFVVEEEVSLLLGIGLYIRTDESVTVEDVVGTPETVCEVSVDESVVVGEISSVSFVIGLSVSDSVTLTELIRPSWLDPSGVFVIDCDIIVPLLDCELMLPEINIYMQLPTIDLEVT